MAPSAVKKRKLSDLFRVGREFVIDDPEGAMTVYLRKLNPVEQETATRKANAVRARYLSELKDSNSETFMSLSDDLIDYDHDSLIEYAAADEVVRRSDAIEAEWAEEAGWNKDDYLQGIFDAWKEWGEEKYFTTDDPEERDPEAQRLYDELQRYNDNFSKRIDQERQYLTKEFKNKPLEELQKLMIERIGKMQADIYWLVEFRKWEVYLGTRDIEDHRQSAFESRAEVDELSETTLQLLVGGYQSLNVEVDQGKDLPETPPSSE